ncbi:MAG: yjeF [Deltaproteobacteria bacterium]|nr:yjeF [Deltaproteobacteria bacterium]
MKAVTAEVMQQLDRRTIEEYGVPGLELMERAGANAAAIIQERFGAVADPSALILAGKGNNGGDGLVIARILASQGWRAEVILFAAPAALAGDARVNYDRLPPAVTITSADSAIMDRLTDCCGGFTVLVDALCGTGLTSGLAGPFAGAAVSMNAAGRPVVAVDIPSGVDASTGKVPGAAVKAALTITFGAAKLGHLLYPGAAYAGALVVTDIGIPAALLAAAPGVTYLDEDHAASLLQTRSRTAHKGSNGHALIVAGSTGKSGAAAMAANSAMRSGAGLVTLAVPKGLHAILELKTTEAMTVPLADCPAGSIGADALEEILSLASGKNVMAVGPGIGTAAETASVVRSIVAAAALPLVIDADGLNALAADPAGLAASEAPFIILTPHPGEMARLAGVTTAEVESDRLATARTFSAAHTVYLVLKGARTVIAAPDGRIAINGSGNPGMASGGSGDVLTGIITALVAQGYEPFAACCLGVFIHGLAADLAAAEKGEIGLIATDIQEMLPYAFKRLMLIGVR